VGVLAPQTANRVADVQRLFMRVITGDGRSAR
jgi:hypothetical protein